MRYQLDDIEKIIQQRLSHYVISINREEDKMTISHPKGGAVNVSLRTLLAKANEQENLKNIDEAIYYITTSLTATSKDDTIRIDLSKVYPVIRAASFPVTTKSGIPFITTSHTSETTIYYALDLGSTYRLIDEQLLRKSQISVEQIQQGAMMNVKQLTVSLATDEVLGNKFYFVNNKDGYDASRLVNDEWLASLISAFSGQPLIAVPHQDTLIIADIMNQAGYDMMSKIAIHYFTEGLVPITSMTFSYDNGKLIPLFILVQDN